MHTRSHTWWIAVLLFLVSGGLALAQATALTYQGVLQQNGQLLNGRYDFQFVLYGSADNTDQASTPVTVNGVLVTAGQFSVTLDFGQSPFSGAERWLEIMCKPEGTVAYTPLSPRQKLTAAPFALNAFSLKLPLYQSNVINSNPMVSLSNAGTNGMAIFAQGQRTGMLGQTYIASGVGLIGINTDGSYQYEQGSGVSGFSAVGNGVSGITSYATGYGLYGRASTGVGVYGTSGQGVAARFEISNTASTAKALEVSQAGSGSGASFAINNASSNNSVVSVSHTGSGPGILSTTAGNALWGITSSISSAGVLGDNMDGEAVVGRSRGNNGIGAVVGRNDGTGYGVRGFNTTTGIGVFGTSQNGIAAKFEALGSGTGLSVRSASGNLIEAYGSSSSDKKFLVTQAGNVRADGTFASPAADFAELLPAVAGLQPGDVLIINENGKLARSTKANQPTVIGVYSTKPAFQGGDSADNTGKAPVAVVGVVPVKASAENGAIKPGDLLVASNTPGHAMKAGNNPKVGIVIGKALAGLSKGKGTIQMLVISH